MRVKKRGFKREYLEMLIFKWWEEGEEVFSGDGEVVKLVWKK